MEILKHKLKIICFILLFILCIFYIVGFKLVEIDLYSFRHFFKLSHKATNVFERISDNTSSLLAVTPTQTNNGFNHKLNNISRAISNASSVQNLFIETKVSPMELYLINQNVTFSNAYGDKNFLGTCMLKSPRQKFFNIIKCLLEITSKYNITFFAGYGTAVGAWRHNDSVPWDHDLDFIVFQRDEAKIRRIQSERKKLSPTTCNLVTRPGPFCLYNGPTNKRQTCDGKHVSKHQDVCSFCGPLARMLNTNGGPWADLYLINPETALVNNEQVVYDEGKYDDTGGKRNHTSINVLFPLQKCNFMNLTLLCPNQLQAYIKSHYGSEKPSKVCKNGNWT